MINDKYFDQFPNLESTRLIFRKFSLEDAKDIQFIRSNNEVMDYMDSKRHDSIQDSEAFIAESIVTYQKKAGLFWVIMEKSSNKFIGDFSFWRIDRKHARAEIGYTLKPEFWGKGFMTEAMKTLIKFGFDELKIHSFEANINPENGNSQKVLLKMGFQKEAYFRENYYFDGKFLDSEIYGLLESDFLYKDS